MITFTLSASLRNRGLKLASTGEPHFSLSRWEDKWTYAAQSPMSLEPSVSIKPVHTFDKIRPSVLHLQMSFSLKENLCSQKRKHSVTPPPCGFWFPDQAQCRSLPPDVCGYSIVEACSQSPVLSLSPIHAHVRLGTR